MSSPRPALFRGPPRERGRARGAAERAALAKMMGSWRAELERELGLALEAYVEDFLGDTQFLRAAREYTPDLCEEVLGLSEGAQLPFELLFALQLMDERWEDLERRGLAASCRCSSLAIFDGSKGAPHVLAQNMDLPKSLDGLQQLVQLVDDASGLRILLLSYPGFLGLFGLNSRGVGVCVNNLWQLQAAPSGLPVAFVIRGALAQPSLEAAVAFVSAVPHATGQSYLIGSSEGVMALECSAGGVVSVDEVLPGRICHTNHPLRSDDLQPRYRGWADDEDAADASQGRTFSRLRALRRALLAEARPTLEEIIALLSDEASYVCKTLDGPFESFTFGSGVLELSAHAPRAHFAVSTPSLGRYRAYEFDFEQP